MTNPAFYGGGHRMRTAVDFAYWCQKSVSSYGTSTDVFVPPQAAPGSDVQTYSRIAGCAERAGIPIPTAYPDLLWWLQDEGCLVTPVTAMRTRGALLLNKGAVAVALGDGRVVVEANFQLTVQHVGAHHNYLSMFEYGALLPGMYYL